MIDVKGIVEAVKGVAKFKGDFLSLWVYVSPAEVQLRADVFDDAFTDYEISSRDCEKYPYEKCFVVDGVKFFALYSEAELNEQDRVLIERGRVTNG